MIRKTAVGGTQCRRFFCFSVLFKRNAYMLRTPLSPLRVPRVTYVSVSSPRTSAGFADCLHLCVLTVHGGARNGRNAYLLRNTLSGLRFCSLPYLMVRGAASPHSCLPFLIKGRCHEVTEGIRKSVSEKTRDVKSLLLPSLCKRGAIGATLSRPFPVQKGKRAGAFFRKTFLKKFFQTLDLQYESVL